MTVLVVLLVLVAALIGAGAGAMAMRTKKSFAAANEVVPGTATTAPPGWAGAHSPEALLHRRLRAAVDAARVQATVAGSAYGDVVAAVERGAIDIDNRLVVAAALPAQHRDAAVASLEPAVVAIENAVAGASASPGAVGTGTGQVALDAAVADVQLHLDALASARSEVDQLDAAPRQAGGTTATP